MNDRRGYNGGVKAGVLCPEQDDQGVRTGPSCVAQYSTVYLSLPSNCSCSYKTGQVV